MAEEWGPDSKDLPIITGFDSLNEAVAALSQRMADQIFEKLEKRIGDLVQEAAAKRVPHNIAQKLDILVKLRVADLQRGLSSAIASLSHTMSGPEGAYERKIFETEWATLFTDIKPAARKRRTVKRHR